VVMPAGERSVGCDHRVPSLPLNALMQMQRIPCWHIQEGTAPDTAGEWTIPTVRGAMEAVNNGKRIGFLSSKRRQHRASNITTMCEHRHSVSMRCDQQNSRSHTATSIPHPARGMPEFPWKERMDWQASGRVSLYIALSESRRPADPMNQRFPTHGHGAGHGAHQRDRIRPYHTTISVRFRHHPAWRTWACASVCDAVSH
jgi:hypothetical protein